jgi:hypothetical protein
MITVFSFFFVAVIQLLVTETNKYYNQYLDTLENASGSSRLPDVTVQEMYVPLALIIQMGHDKQDIPNDYWTTLVQYYTPFYSNMRKHM